jgi:hypothetical protein
MNIADAAANRLRQSEAGVIKTGTTEEMSGDPNKEKQIAGR